MTDSAPNQTGSAAARNGEPPALDQAFDGDSLYALRAAVAAHGSQAGLSDGRTRDLVLAVHELAANAVRHGAGQGRLRMWATAEGVRCEVTDEGADGTGEEPAEAPVWRVEPGHGLWLVRRIADGASVRSDPSGTVAGLYKVNSLPSSFFIAPDGTIRAINIGPMDQPLIEQNLRRASS